MFSIDSQQELMVKTIEQTVSILMEKPPLFKEELNYEDMVQHLTRLFEKNLSIEEFNTILNEDLKQRCAGILSTELRAGMLDDFTPEQRDIFYKIVNKK
jgi:hypothetical protein